MCKHVPSAAGGVQVPTTTFAVAPDGVTVLTAPGGFQVAGDQVVTGKLETSGVLAIAGIPDVKVEIEAMQSEIDAVPAAIATVETNVVASCTATCNLTAQTSAVAANKDEAAANLAALAAKVITNKDEAATNLAALTARVTTLEAENVALRKLTAEFGAFKKELKDSLLKAGVNLESPTLTSSEFTVCGVATNPTSWQQDRVGMLGTYTSRRDDNNWSVDCRVAVKNAIEAGATSIVMRIYDPVDSNHMDFSYTLSARAWYDAFQNPADDPSNSAVSLTASSKPTSFGGFFSHKIWSVGSSATTGNIYSRVLTEQKYVQQYCNGGATTYKYAGIGTKTAFNFIVGGGGTAHAALCSTGLGVYGNSMCTTGKQYNCYIGGNTCNDSGERACRSDAAQRAAVAIKLA